VEWRSPLISSGNFCGKGRKPNSAPRGEGGFTLVEILIMMLIVGILSAISIPNYLRFRDKQKEKTAISDIHVIASRITSFMMENTWPPDLETLNNGQTIHPIPLIDPWGHPYQYLPLLGNPGNLAQARKDHNLHPINTDFDLYSMGPDGQSLKPLTAQKSRDDIIRANDGAFVGVASTYDP